MARASGGTPEIERRRRESDRVRADEVAPGVAAPGQAALAEAEPSAGETGPVEVAEAWLAGLEDKLAVSASDVQDHLLDLWGVLEEGPARAEVERWLTETLRRNVYSVSDINDRLEALLPSG